MVSQQPTSQPIGQWQACSSCICVYETYNRCDMIVLRSTIILIYIYFGSFHFSFLLFVFYLLLESNLHESSDCFYPFVLPQGV